MSFDSDDDESDSSIPNNRTTTPTKKARKSSGPPTRQHVTPNNRNRSNNDVTTESDGYDGDAAGDSEEPVRSDEVSTEPVDDDDTDDRGGDDGDVFGQPGYGNVSGHRQVEADMDDDRDANTVVVRPQNVSSYSNFIR